MPYKTTIRPENKFRSERGAKYVEHTTSLASGDFTLNNGPRMESQTIVLDNLSNQEFLERYAQPGRVGLCGGMTRVDTVIRRAQRHLHEERRWSDWSHVFLFQGQRADGHHWVIESDIQILRKNIQVGAQENRITKYFDATAFPALVILDFGLDETQVSTLLREGLEAVASHERYSIRELIGTLAALKKPELRARENRFSRERSIYCSAFVQRLFFGIGLDLVPGVTAKHSAPEDIVRTLVPHTKYLLMRPLPGPKEGSLLRRVTARVRRQRDAGLKRKTSAPND